MPAFKTLSVCTLHSNTYLRMSRRIHYSISLKSWPKGLLPKTSFMTVLTPSVARTAVAVFRPRLAISGITNSREPADGKTLYDRHKSQIRDRTAATYTQTPASTRGFSAPSSAFIDPRAESGAAPESARHVQASLLVNAAVTVSVGPQFPRPRVPQACHVLQSIRASPMHKSARENHSP